MVKPELGIKRSCLNCAAHFYDLGRDPAICPKCGNSHPLESFMKMRRSRPGSPEDRKAAAKRKLEVRPEAADTADAFDSDPVVADDDADEEVIEDTEDLGGDDDIGAEIPRDNDDPNER